MPLFYSLRRISSSKHHYYFYFYFFMLFSFYLITQSNLLPTFNLDRLKKKWHRVIPQGLNQMPIRIYIVLAVFAALASVSISLLLYVQRKATRRQRQSVEEPEVEGHEEDKSTLLGAESQETEEKE